MTRGFAKALKTYGKVVCIDIDGTLAVGMAWTKKDVLKAPLNTNIAKHVASLYKKCFIVIYTARRDNLIPATLEWLRRNNIQYHAFSNRKIPADHYIDDKMSAPQAWPEPKDLMGFTVAELKEIMSKTELGEFSRWMYGQTCSVLKNGDLGYFKEDVWRFLNHVRGVKGYPHAPVIWD